MRLVIAILVSCCRRVAAYRTQTQTCLLCNHLMKDRELTLYYGLSDA